MPGSAPKLTKKLLHDYIHRPDETTHQEIMALTAEELAVALNTMTKEDIQAIKDYPELLLRLADKYKMYHEEYEFNSETKTILDHGREAMKRVSHGHDIQDLHYEDEFLATTLEENTAKRRAHLRVLKEKLLDDPEEEKIFTVDRFKKFCKIYKGFKSNVLVGVKRSDNFNGLGEDGFLKFLQELEEKGIIKEIKDPDASETHLLKKFTFAVDADDAKVKELLGEGPAKGDITEPADKAETLDKKQPIKGKVTPVDATIVLKVDGVDCNASNGTLNAPDATTGEWSFVPNDEWTVGTHAIELTTTVGTPVITDVQNSSFEVKEKTTLEGEVNVPANGSKTLNTKQPISGTSTAGSTLSLKVNGTDCVAPDLVIAPDGTWKYTPNNHFPIGIIAVDLTITSADATVTEHRTSSFEVIQVTELADMMQHDAFDRMVVNSSLNFTQKRERIALLQHCKQKILDVEEEIDGKVFLEQVREMIPPATVADVFTTDTPPILDIVATLRAIYDKYHIGFADISLYNTWLAGGATPDASKFNTSSMKDVENLMKTDFDETDKSTPSAEFSRVYTGSEDRNTRRSSMVEVVRQFILDNSASGAGSLHTLLASLRSGDGLTHDDVVVYGFHEDQNYVQQQITMLCGVYKIDKDDVTTEIADAKKKEDAANAVKKDAAKFNGITFKNPAHSTIYLQYLVTSYLDAITDDKTGDVVFRDDAILFDLAELGIDISRIQFDTGMSTKTNPYLYVIDLLQHPTKKVLKAKNILDKNHGKTNEFKKSFNLLEIQYQTNNAVADTIDQENTSVIEQQRLSRFAENLTWRDQSAVLREHKNIADYMVYQYLMVITGKGTKLLPDGYKIPYEKLGIIPENFSYAFRDASSDIDTLGRFSTRTPPLITNRRFYPLADTHVDIDYREKLVNNLPYALSSSRQLPGTMKAAKVNVTGTGGAQESMEKLVSLINNAIAAGKDKNVIKDLKKLLIEGKAQDALEMYSLLHKIYTTDELIIAGVQGFFGLYVKEYAKNSLISKSNWKGYVLALAKKYPEERGQSLADLYQAAKGGKDNYANGLPIRSENAVLWDYIKNNLDRYLPLDPVSGGSTSMLEKLIEDAFIGCFREIYASTYGANTYGDDTYDPNTHSPEENLKKYIDDSKRKYQKRFEINRGKELVKYDERKSGWQKVVQKWPLLDIFSKKGHEKQAKDIFESDVQQNTLSYFLEGLDNNAYATSNPDLAPQNIQATLDQNQLVSGTVACSMIINGRQITINTNIIEASSAMQEIWEKTALDLGMDGKTPGEVNTTKFVAMYEYMNLLYGSMIEKHGTLSSGKGFYIDRDNEGCLVISQIKSHDRGSEMVATYNRTSVMKIIQSRPEQAMNMLIEMMNILEATSYDMAVSAKLAIPEIKKYNKEQLSATGGRSGHEVAKNAFSIHSYFYKQDKKPAAKNKLGRDYKQERDTKGNLIDNKQVLIIPKITEENLGCFEVLTIPATTANPPSPEQKWMCMTDKYGKTSYYLISKINGSSSDWKVIRLCENLEDVFGTLTDVKLQKEFLRKYSTQLIRNYKKMHREIKKNYEAMVVIQKNGLYYKVIEHNNEMRCVPVKIPSEPWSLVHIAMKRGNYGSYTSRETTCGIFDWKNAENYIHEEPGVSAMKLDQFVDATILPVQIQSAISESLHYTGTIGWDNSFQEGVRNLIMGFF